MANTLRSAWRLIMHAEATRRDQSTRPREHRRIVMRGVRISYLIEYPEYVPELAQWLSEQYNFIPGEKTLKLEWKN